MRQHASGSCRAFPRVLAQFPTRDVDHCEIHQAHPPQIISRGEGIPPRPESPLDTHGQPIGRPVYAFRRWRAHGRHVAAAGAAGATRSLVTFPIDGRLVAFSRLGCVEPFHEGARVGRAVHVLLRRHATQQMAHLHGSIR